MKFSAAETPARRPYRQLARAQAAEATGRRVIAAFVEAMRHQWLEDITLDQVARAAGVSVQTIIRRFGGKDGLILAAREHVERGVLARRAVPVGHLAQVVANLCADYEVSGDMFIRLLAQEERFPALKPFLAYGRAGHRRWVSEVASPWLADLGDARREATLDALVAAMDVYVWKLIRRDLGRSAEETRAVLLSLAKGALGQGSTGDEQGRKP